MAITVKDIQEKDFGTQKVNGYNVEEVDDFLDEIAEQLGALIRENLALEAQVERLDKELEEAKTVVPAPVEEPVSAAKEPEYDDENYFKNLQTAIRESLIGSQRIADETVAKARRQADQMINEAQEKAAQIVSDANAEAENVKAEYEGVRKAIENYRASFRKLVEDQVQVYKNNSSIFD